MKRRVVLLIMDGWGLRDDSTANAVKLAQTPVVDGLLKAFPHTRLDPSGRAVGLPDAQMGNSEVGHLNLGAGRVVRQDIVRVSDAIDDGSFFAAVESAFHVSINVIIILITTQIVLKPYRRCISREPFVQPEMCPIFARHQIAKPLMAQLMRDEPIRAVIQMGAFVMQRTGAKRGSAGVFHASAKLLRTDLCVLIPGIFHTEGVAEKIQHTHGIGKAAFDILFSIRRNIIANRFSAPGFFFQVKLSYNQRHQIGNMGFVL